MLDDPCAAQGEGLWPETPRARCCRRPTGRPNLLPENDEPIEDFVERVARASAGARPRPLLVLQRRLVRPRPAAAAYNGTHLRAGRHRRPRSRDPFGMPAGAAGGHIALPGQDPVPAPATYSPAASAAGSQWWATADQLLDFAALNLRGGSGVFAADDVMSVRTPTAPLPGATVFDAWGMGWAVWDRGAHQAFGWAGYTGGHRAFLRCFPEQDAALVLLANSAGPLFGPPGGSALFDSLLPDMLELLEVPALGAPSYGDSDAGRRAGRQLRSAHRRGPRSRPDRVARRAVRARRTCACANGSVGTRSTCRATLRGARPSPSTGATSSTSGRSRCRGRAPAVAQPAESAREAVGCVIPGGWSRC